MHGFSYKELEQSLLIPDIVRLLSTLAEYKGSQQILKSINPERLEALVEIAKIQSTGSSNRIEGIYTSDKRLKELVEKKTMPQNRDESEISGYREVLTLIHENYEHISITPNTILQLHRDLYSFHPTTDGGCWKNNDNFITETTHSGETRTRFVPVSAFQTPLAINQLCIAFNEVFVTPYTQTLPLIFAFILDFLCIHPFNDGNGRMSRLLTLLLLYKAGYFVGQYISIERIIENSKETYYDALQHSSEKWHDGKNSYFPFIYYSLSVLVKAYQDFMGRAEVFASKQTKFERIKNMFDQTPRKLSKKDIAVYNPDISIQTIEAALNTLSKEQYIMKIGAGRSTHYAKIKN
jgi:Fic family protein